MVAAGGKPIPVVGDVDCPNGCAFGMRKDTFAWSELGKPDWVMQPDGKGSIFHLQAGQTAGTHVAEWVAYFEWWATSGEHPPPGERPHRPVQRRHPRGARLSIGAGGDVTEVRRHPVVVQPR